MRPVAVINPMKSRRPTGIGIAGDELPSLIGAARVRACPFLNRLFSAINDMRAPNSLRALLRLSLVQLSPLFFTRQALLLYTTHHAPLWRTGRHALVLYDSIPLQFPQQAPSQTRYFLRLLPRILRCAERIVVISAAVRDEFIARGYLTKESSVVIPAGSPRVWRGAASVSTGKREPRQLLVVGARYPHKNIDVVLGAIEKLNQRGELQWTLILAGAVRHLWGRAWGGIEHFERLGWVRVLERVDDNQLADLYSKASVLVYPSLAEGQGLPPLEAMAFGCPVICSDLPVLRETCGEAAVYFKVDDAEMLMRRIIETTAAVSEDGREKQMKACRDRMALFDRDALAQRWRLFWEAWN